MREELSIRQAGQLQRSRTVEAPPLCVMSIASYTGSLVQDTA